MESIKLPPIQIGATLDQKHLAEAVRQYLSGKGYDASMAGVTFHRTPGDRPGESDMFTASVTGLLPKGGSQ